MATKDYAKHVAPGIRPLLRAGERLLAASPLTKDQGTTEDVSVKDELANLLDPTILLGLGAHPGTLIQRAAFGRALIGGLGSTGRRLFEAVDAVPGPKVVVTTQRLLIVELDTMSHHDDGGFWRRWFGTVEYSGRFIHDVPREAILGAVAAPAGVLRRGRLWVCFTDRSACSLVCVPGLADSVIRGIGAPRPDGRSPVPDERPLGEE